MARSSIANSIVAWRNAIANAKASGEAVPGLDGYVATLEQILAQAQDLTATLDMRRGVKQQETQDRRALIQAGNVQVSRLRSAVKAYFGPNSERVIEFGARPVRPRTKKKQVPPPQVTPPPATPGSPPPEASGSPPAVASGSPQPAAAPSGNPAPKDEAPRNPTAA